MAQARSLHIGLNEVDPAAYGGWDGRLAGCHNDVTSMQGIADALGYRSAKLLDREANADDVIAAIRDAARSLSGGDIFLLTYSGHGGQVDDTNGEEPDRLDETWVLWDRMLIDDELYALWAEFQPDVRIAVVSDSCHSGSVTRAVPFASDGSPLPLQRRMPLDVERRTYEEHKDLYDGIQARVPTREGSSIGAAVQLISGCQDNQTSADGSGNGLFTGTLLEVWQDGRFEGSMHVLRDQIAGRMPSDQTPNYYIVGTPSTPFEDGPAFRP